jgi:geranylgeranyl pyrophosphate synthase
MNDSAIGQKVKDAYAKEDLDPKAAREVAELIKGSDAVSKCEQAIEGCRKKALDLIDELPDSEYRTALKEFLQTI